MVITKQVDLGEYIIVIDYNDDGSGYIKVSILDELEEEIDFVEVSNDDPEEIDPKLN
jgi:hypothetical protein